MNCPKFGFDVTDSLQKSYCLNCPDKCEFYQRWSSSLRSVDPFELARLLKEKRDKKEGHTA